MGVPKLFWFVRNRYRNMMKDARKHNFAPVDYCYVDMNSVIHNCVPKYEKANIFPPTAEAVCLRVGAYIDNIVKLVNPRSVLFLAIDGVAPRAKMSQQRMRRHLSMGIDDIFDSNCISPGTEFMQNFEDQIKKFIVHKIETDVTWSHLKVYFSGHLSPGEGEHKIMSFIRNYRNSNNYNPNLRHCICGLDSDLLFLMMASHELNFIWIREDARNINMDANLNDFKVIYLSILIELIEYEFDDAIKKMKFPYNVNRFFDDFVLLGFFVGNDFIPHLPYFNLDKNSLSEQLWEAYKEVLPLLDDYIVGIDGEINSARLEMLLSVIRRKDFELYLAREVYFPRTDVMDVDNQLKNLNLEQFEFDSDEFTDCSQESTISYSPVRKRKALTEQDETEMSKKYFKMERFDHYSAKLEEQITQEKVANLSNHYLRTIQWIMFYYRSECPSNQWYYPFYYAPYAIDLGELSPDMKVFDREAPPFSPFEQLLAILPITSRSLVPGPLQSLISMTDSPISHFYVEEFKTDSFQKVADYEKIALIPFVDMIQVTNSLSPLLHLLREEETQRNQTTPFICYFAETPKIVNIDNPSTVICEEVDWRPFSHSYSSLVSDKKDYINNYSIPFLHRIDMKINTVSSSLGKVMEFEIGHPKLTNIKKLHNNHLSYDWPFLKEGKVVGVHTEDFDIGKKLEGTFQSVSHDITTKYAFESNIYLKSVGAILDICPCIGFGFSSTKNFKLIKRYDNSKVYEQPLSTTLTKCIKHVPNLKIDDIFPINSTAFVLSQEYLGWKVTLIKFLRDNIFKVSMMKELYPSFRPLRQEKERIDRTYISESEMANELEFSPDFLSNVIGYQKVKLEINRHSILNIGLGLKNESNNSAIGYSLNESSHWIYSLKALDLVKEYSQRFPKMFSNWAKLCNHTIHHKALLKDCGDNETLEEVFKFLYDAKSRFVLCHGVEDYVDPTVYDNILTTLSQISLTETVVEMRIDKLLPACDAYEDIFFPINFEFTDINYKCLDRIFYVAKNQGLPFGCRGTVVWTSQTDRNYVGILFDHLISSRADHKTQVLKISISEILPLKMVESSPVKSHQTLPIKVMRRREQKGKPKDILMQKVREAHNSIDRAATSDFKGSYQSPRQKSGNSTETFDSSPHSPSHNSRTNDEFVPSVERPMHVDSILTNKFHELSDVSYRLLHVVPLIDTTFDGEYYQTNLIINNKLYQGSRHSSKTMSVDTICQTSLDLLKQHPNSAYDYSQFHPGQFGYNSDYSQPMMFSQFGYPHLRYSQFPLPYSTPFGKNNYYNRQNY